jgi:hypothetical protein
VGFQPRFGVEVRVQIDTGDLGWPGFGVDSYARSNCRTYENLTRARWRDVDAAVAIEDRLIGQCVDLASNGEEFADMFKDAESTFGELGDFDHDDFFEYAFLDLGVASATLALNAAGCPTLTSCNGHYTGYPWIGFLCRPDKLPLVHEAANLAQVGLINADDGTVEAFSDRPDGLLAFAKELRRRSAQFRRIRSRRQAMRSPGDHGSVKQLTLMKRADVPAQVRRVPYADGCNALP